jgi:hypothetical protein
VAHLLEPAPLGELPQTLEACTAELDLLLEPRVRRRGGRATLTVKQGSGHAHLDRVAVQRDVALLDAIRRATPKIGWRIPDQEFPLDLHAFDLPRSGLVAAGV